MDGERVDSGARVCSRIVYAARRRRATGEREREGERETRISRHAGELPQSVNDFTLVSVTAFSRLCVPGSTQTFTKAPPPVLPSSPEVGRVSNVNRARSLENSFPRGRIVFELVADRRREFSNATPGSGKRAGPSLLYIPSVKKQRGGWAQ